MKFRFFFIGYIAITLIINTSCKSDNVALRKVNVDSLVDASNVSTSGVSSFKTKEEAQARLDKLIQKLETVTDEEEKHKILEEINDVKRVMSNFTKSNLPPVVSKKLTKEDSAKIAAEVKLKKLLEEKEKEELEKVKETIDKQKKSLNVDNVETDESKNPPVIDHEPDPEVNENKKNIQNKTETAPVEPKKDVTNKKSL